MDEDLKDYIKISNIYGRLNAKILELHHMSTTFCGCFLFVSPFNFNDFFPYEKNYSFSIFFFPFGSLGSFIFITSFHHFYPSFTLNCSFVFNEPCEKFDEIPEKSSKFCCDVLWYLSFFSHYNFQYPFHSFWTCTIQVQRNIRIITISAQHMFSLYRICRNLKIIFLFYLSRNVGTIFFSLNITNFSSPQLNKHCRLGRTNASFYTAMRQIWSRLKNVKAAFLIFQIFQLVES